MQTLPVTQLPLVVRTGFENEQAWESVVELIRAPVVDGDEIFKANVEFVSDPAFRDLSTQALVARLPERYPHTVLFAVDATALENPETPVLAIDLYREPGRTFRAVPSQVQAIENNLSIANMDFDEFARNVDRDGVFRGFR